MRKPRASKTSTPESDRHLTDELGESIGFLIADTARAVKRSLYIRIGLHGVRGGHWYFLRALWKMDGLTQRELSRELGLMEPSVLEMIRSMERDGLVRRERDTKDRRKIRIYLTPKALKLERPLMRIANELNSTMLSSVSKSNEKQLKKLLLAIRHTMATDFVAVSAQNHKAKALALINEPRFETEVPSLKRSAGRAKQNGGTTARG